MELHQIERPFKRHSSLRLFWALNTGSHALFMWRLQNICGGSHWLWERLALLPRLPWRTHRQDWVLRVMLHGTKDQTRCARQGQRWRRPGIRCQRLCYTTCTCTFSALIPNREPDCTTVIYTSMRSKKRTPSPEACSLPQQLNTLWHKKSMTQCTSCGIYIHQLKTVLLFFLLQTPWQFIVLWMSQDLIAYPVMA